MLITLCLNDFLPLNNYALILVIIIGTVINIGSDRLVVASVFYILYIGGLGFEYKVFRS